MRKFLSFVFFIFCSLNLSADPLEGGVIGNARINFVSPLIGVTGSIPKSWDSLDFGTLLSFTKSSAVASHNSFITLASEQKENISSTQELEKFVENKNPQGEWEKITWDGLDGFESYRDEKGEIYLLGQNNTVLTIHYNKKDDSEDIESILESLIFTH